MKRKTNTRRKLKQKNQKIENVKNIFYFSKQFNKF